MSVSPPCNGWWSTGAVKWLCHGRLYFATWYTYVRRNKRMYLHAYKNTVGGNTKLDLSANDLLYFYTRDCVRVVPCSSTSSRKKITFYFGVGGCCCCTYVLSHANWKYKKVFLWDRDEIMFRVRKNQTRTWRRIYVLGTNFLKAYRHSKFYWQHKGIRDSEQNM